MMQDPNNKLTRMDQCNQLIGIDNRGERLTAYLSCNLWLASGEKLWIELCAKDLVALHETG